MKGAILPTRAVLPISLVYDRLFLISVATTKVDADLGDPTGQAYGRYIKSTQWLLLYIVIAAF
jgi:hypothetical protein